MLSLTIISLLLAFTPADTIPTMVDIPGTHIRMSATEVTNAQYEAFYPFSKRTFSTGDNDKATFCSVVTQVPAVRTVPHFTTVSRTTASTSQT